MLDKLTERKTPDVGFKTGVINMISQFGNQSKLKENAFIFIIVGNDLEIYLLTNN